MPKIDLFCSLCEEFCRPEDYCKGCGEYICQKCDVRVLSGVHKALDHIQEEEST